MRSKNRRAHFALKRYIRAHAPRNTSFIIRQKRPIGQIIVVDDGYDLFLTMTMYPNSVGRCRLNPRRPEAALR